MARNLYYQDGVSLRNVRFLYYQDGANLRVITEGYYQDGANLRQWWPPEFVFLSNQTANANRILPDPANAQAQMGVYADGFYKRSINGGANTNLFQWLLAGGGVASDYDVRLTAVSGTTPAGPALSTWFNLGTDRVWTLVKAGGSVGSVSFTGTLEVGFTGTGVAITSSTITFNATVSI